MVKIKRIITAIGNTDINEKLNCQEIKVLCGDIIYKEGVIEYLEENSDVDFIVLNDELTGSITTEELIENVKNINNKIRIIIITNRHDDKLKVYRKIETADFTKIKNIILNKNSVFNMKTIPINNFFDFQTKDGKVVDILGSNGIGKTIFSLILAHSIKNKKILIMDLDILNDSMINLLGIRKKAEQIKNNNLSYSENIDVSDFIVKIEKNIDYLLSMNLFFNTKLQVSSKRIRNIINNMKTQYDYIIVDTSTSAFWEYTKEIVKIADENIFISGANMLEIRKSQKLLELFINECNTEKEKIKIIFNKFTKNSIDDEILKELFDDYDIIGKIKLSDYYDLAINKNKINKDQIEKETKDIGKKIVKFKVHKKRKVV